MRPAHPPAWPMRPVRPISSLQLPSRGPCPAVFILAGGPGGQNGLRPTRANRMPVSMPWRDSTNSDPVPEPLDCIPERTHREVKGLTVARKLTRIAPGPSLPIHGSQQHVEIAEKTDQTRDTAGQCRARSAVLLRVREPAGLSRLDGALSDRRGSGRASI